MSAIDWIKQRWQVAKQDREIDRLRAEVRELEARNERTRQAIQRCVPCDYRLQALAMREADASTTADSADQR